MLLFHRYQHKDRIQDYLILDDNLGINVRLDGDQGDLLANLLRAVEVQDALVDAHLVTIVGVGPLTTRRLARGDAEDLGRQTDGAGDLEVLDLGAGQGDPDTVDLGIGSELFGFIVHIEEGRIPRKSWL